MTDRRFTKEDVHLLFALRTRMTNCKVNFKKQFGNNLKCIICEDEESEENEDHVLNCTVVNGTETYDVQFTDVYGDADAQYKAVQVYKKVLRTRQIYLEMEENLKNSHIPSD